ALAAAAAGCGFAWLHDPAVGESSHQAAAHVAEDLASVRRAVDLGRRREPHELRAALADERQAARAAAFRERRDPGALRLQVHLERLALDRVADVAHEATERTLVRADLHAGERALADVGELALQVPELLGDSFGAPL